MAFEKREKVKSVAQDIINSYNMLNLTRKSMNSLLIYDDEEGVYKENPYMLDSLIYHNGSELVREEVEQVKHEVRAKINPIYKGQLNVDETYLPVNNGLLELKTGELHPFTPERYFTKKLSVDYDSNAKLPEQFYNLLGKLFEGYEWEIDVLQEYMGYLLYYGHPYKKFLYLHGSPESGIDEILDLMKLLIDDENRSSFTFKDILKDNSSVQLEYYNKLLNICGEAGDTTVSTSQLAKLFGENIIKVDEKYEDGFIFKNRTKLVFKGEDLPDPQLLGKKFVKRLIILDLPHRINSDDVDLSQIKRMCYNQDQELSKGLLTWALTGLQRLLKNNEFSNMTKSNKKTNYVLSINEDPVNMFIEDFLINKSGVSIPKETVYKMYCGYVSKLDKKPLGKNTFYKKFVNKCRYKFGYMVDTAQKPDSNGKRRQSFTNIEVR